MADGGSKFNRRRLDAGATSELVEHAAGGTAAGLPLDEIFRALAEDTDNRRLRSVAGQIAARLHRGGDMTSALRDVEHQLPPYLRRALAASSDLGQTTAVLAGLAEHETNRVRLRRQMLSAMLYPAVVVGLLAAVVVGLAILVIPQFEAAYADTEMQLPDLTLSLINVARVIPWVVAAIAAVGVGLWIISYSEGGARLVHWLRTGAPFVGQLWAWNAHHELASILRALVGQRVPIDHALGAAASSLRDRNLARSVRIAANKCADGVPLSRALAESMHVDPALPALVSWGEASDSLPQALEQAAATF
jgi:type II secretory pathway component PulF